MEYKEVRKTLELTKEDFVLVSRELKPKKALAEPIVFFVVGAALLTACYSMEDKGFSLAAVGRGVLWSFVLNGAGYFFSEWLVARSIRRALRQGGGHQHIVIDQKGFRVETDYEVLKLSKSELEAVEQTENNFIFRPKNRKQLFFIPKKDLDEGETDFLTALIKE